MSWRGTDLVVSSQDGSVKYLSFREKELGTMLTSQKMYCNNGSLSPLETPSKASSSFIDSPEELMAKRKVRTSDGKRRIQPIFLGSTVDDESAPAPTPVQSKAQPSTEPMQTDDPTISDGDEGGGRDKSPSKSVGRLASTDDSMVESSDDDLDSSDVDAKGEKETVQLEKLTERTKMMMADFKKPTLRPIDSYRVEVTPAIAILDVPDQRATMSEGVQGV
ncbi:hypothetical protein ANCCEY_14499 [Ancylostoma ceylanicum]|uniref:Uncharacterized protein n=1 Tax=Ancylostoma ceylanicum TaxID=53326 RepID=A0A0D6L5G2_9BILA|nr:hypothetical protein ANCCEY_14499 [Ancylostoma ceylanicum]